MSIFLSLFCSIRFLFTSKLHSICIGRWCFVLFVCYLLTICYRFSPFIRWRFSCESIVVRSIFLFFFSFWLLVNCDVRCTRYTTLIKWNKSSDAVTIAMRTFIDCTLRTLSTRFVRSSLIRMQFSTFRFDCITFGLRVRCDFNDDATEGWRNPFCGNFLVQKRWNYWKGIPFTSVSSHFFLSPFPFRSYFRIEVMRQLKCALFKLYFSTFSSLSLAFFLPTSFSIFLLCRFPFDWNSVAFVSVFQLVAFTTL